MQSHQNETCKVCHETMKKKTLYKHMETHKENRTKYECEQCHLSYTRRDSLLRHVRPHSKAQNTPVVIITAKKNTDISLRKM